MSLAPGAPCGPGSRKPNLFRSFCHPASILREALGAFRPGAAILSVKRTGSLQDATSLVGLPAMTGPGL